PLRDGRHRHQERDGDADRRPEEEGDDDQLEGLDLGLDQRPEDRQAHADLAHQDPHPGGGGRAEPLQGKDEERRRDDVADGGEDLLYLRRKVHRRFSRLNIFSMRSVMRNPLMTLMVEAVTATAPRMVLSVVCCSPSTTSDPIRLIAEIALVSD